MVSTLVVEIKWMRERALLHGVPITKRHFMSVETYHALRRASLPRWRRRIIPWLLGRRATNAWRLER